MPVKVAMDHKRTFDAMQGHGIAYNAVASVDGNIAAYGSMGAASSQFGGNVGSSSGKNKRRFVWPENLHRAFIAAVFEAGLNFSNLDDLSVNVSSELKAAFPDLELEDGQLKEYLQKVKTYISTQKSTSGQNDFDERGRGTLELLSSDFEGENRCVELKATIDKLRRESMYIISSISQQNQMLQIMKASISKQTKLYNHFQTKIAILEPLLVEFTPPAPTLDSSNANGDDLETQLNCLNGTYNVGGNSNNNSNPNPPGYSKTMMVSEMKSHMDLHRMLLGRRNDQMHEFMKSTSLRSEISTDEKVGNGSSNYNSDGRSFVVRKTNSSKSRTFKNQDAITSEGSSNENENDLFSWVQPNNTGTGNNMILVPKNNPNRSNKHLLKGLQEVTESIQSGLNNNRRGGSDSEDSSRVDECSTVLPTTVTTNASIDSSNGSARNENYNNNNNENNANARFINHANNMNVKNISDYPYVYGQTNAMTGENAFYSTRIPRDMANNGGTNYWESDPIDNDLFAFLMQ